jgi:hypothetical protein
MLRTMKKIAVELQREVFLPGETVSGTVHLQIDKPVNAREIRLDVEGVEHTFITVSHGKSSHTYHERNHIIKTRITFQHNLDVQSQELEQGYYNFPFEFVIPPKGLPSYHGRNVKITYTLKARVDIPLWFDIKDEKEFYVVRNREDLRRYNKPIHFQSENYLNLEDSKPGFYVEFPKIGFYAGKSIEGTITLCNMQTCKIRKIEMRLIGIEHAKAAKYQRNYKRTKYESELFTDDIIEAMPMRFNFPIPKSAFGSYEGKYSNFRWAFEVQLDIPLKFDVKARCPIEIFR